RGAGSGRPSARLQLGVAGARDDARAAAADNFEDLVMVQPAQRARLGRRGEKGEVRRGRGRSRAGFPGPTSGPSIWSGVDGRENVTGTWEVFSEIGYNRRPGQKNNPESCSSQGLPLAPHKTMRHSRRNPAPAWFVFRGWQVLSPPRPPFWGRGAMGSCRSPYRAASSGAAPVIS